MNGAHLPPSEDRYAALKDLDSLMKQAQLKEETTGNLSTSTWNANNANGKYLVEYVTKRKHKSINVTYSVRCNLCKTKYQSII